MADCEQEELGREQHEMQHLSAVKETSCANLVTFRETQPKMLAHAHHQSPNEFPSPNAKQCVDLRKPDPSKTLAYKIKHERNGLAHGGNFSLGETLACFNKAREFFKSQQASKKHQAERDEVVKWIGILEFAKRRPRSTRVEIDITPSGFEMRSMIFLTAPRSLFGREDMLMQLERLMTSTSNDVDDNRCRARVLLHGCSGVGKTAVVRELADRLKHKLPNQFVLHAGTEKTLDADILCFLHTECSAEVKETSLQPSTSFKMFLQHTTKNFFLIFENVVNPEIVLQLLPQEKHCVIFTSASDQLWRERWPGQVESMALHGLNVEDSFRLLKDVFESARCLPLLREISITPWKKNHLLNILNDSHGLPLAIRSAAFQISQEGVFDEFFHPWGDRCASSPRSEADKVAAGRVHARGFHHVMQHAFTRLKHDVHCLSVGYALSITSWTTAPCWFLEEVGCNLGLDRTKVQLKTDLLVSLGLAERHAEVVSMQPFILNYFIESVPCFYPEMAKDVVAAVLRAICNQTFSRRMPQDEKQNKTLQSELLGGWQATDDRQHVEMYLEHVISRLLGQVQQLDLGMKEVCLLLACLQRCHHHRGVYKENFWNLETLQIEMAAKKMDVGASSWPHRTDPEAVYESLTAYWSFFPCEDHLGQILLDIHQYTSNSHSLDFKRLLCCGAGALLWTNSFRQVLQLYDTFGFTPENLTQSFSREGDEIFASCALRCAAALMNDGDYPRAKRTFLQVLQIWLPISENSSLSIHEEILKTTVELFQCLQRTGQIPEALAMCEAAYCVCQVNHLSKRAPALLLNVCCKACELLVEESLDNNTQDEVWLRRIDCVVQSTPDFSHKVGWKLHRAYVRLLLRVATSSKVNVTMARDVLKRLLSFRLKNRGRVESSLKLDDIIVPLLLVTGSVRQASDLNLDFIAKLCQKIASQAKESNVHSKTIIAKICMCRSYCGTLTANKICILYARASVFLQTLVEPHRSPMQDPFTNAEMCSQFSRPPQPDSSATAEVLRILSRELRRCGKNYMADALEEAFKFWPQTLETE